LRGLVETEPPKATALGLAAAWLGSYRDNMEILSLHPSRLSKDVRINRDIITLLLKAGANPNRQDITGNTAIIIAVGDGNREAARLLIRYHARLDLMGNTQRVSLAEWMNEPGWEFPSPNHIMRCELLKMIEDERTAARIRRSR